MKDGFSGCVAAAGLLCATALYSGAACAGPFEDALKAAYENNPRIKAQRSTLEQSDEQVSQAISNFRPRVGISYSTGRQRTRFDTSQWSYNDSTTKELSVNQPIFKGGSNYYRYSGAKNRVMSGRADLNRQEQNVLFDAISAYMDVVQAAAVLDLSNSNRDVLEKQLDAANNRFEVGDVTRTDVAQSQARLARSKSDSVQAKGNLDSAIAQFERIMGYKPENLPLPQPDSSPELPQTLEDALSIAAKNNPEIISSRFQKEAASDDVGVNVGTILPQVDLVGSMRRQDGAGVTGNSKFDTDSLQLQMEIPLYQRGTEYSRVREAKSVEGRRDHELRDTEEKVRQSTITAWEDYQTSISVIQAQDEAIKAAEIALDGVRQEQQYGARTVLDVLDAEQELFQARVNLVRAERQKTVAVYKLLQVLGDLTVTKLAVNTTPYDPEEHYDSVKWQLLGF